jgi:phosphopantetheinyl transferase (holo-ACP synthase)
MYNNYTFLGNDIVNISIERSKFKHLEQKFMHRVFTTNEQLMIQKSTNPIVTTWMIWAGKEAAFKACQKTNLNLIFSHRKFEIIFDIETFNLQFLLNTANTTYQFSGTIKHQDNNLNATWLISEHLIHCIAILDKHKKFNDLKINDLDLNQIKSKIFPINSENYATESLETKHFAKQYLINNGFDKKIEILRSKIFIDGKLRYAPPMLFINNNPLLNYQISLSHDNGWGAFVYLKTD